MYKENNNIALRKQVNENTENIKKLNIFPKAKQVGTIEELKKINANVDEIYELVGYYSAKDGANHKRVISNEDDGSGIQLSNGKFANVIHNGTVNISWFGAKCDNTSDDSQFIQKALNMNKVRVIEINDNTKSSSVKINDRKIILNKGKLTLTGTIYMSELSSFIGGVINPIKCFAFTLKPNEDKSLKYVKLLNCKIVGDNDKNGGAIKCESTFDKYVAYCNFIDVDISNCWKAVFGEINDSKFILNLEDNEYPIHIAGDRNFLNITGNAKVPVENNKVIYINGNSNSVIGNIINVGKTTDNGNYQNIFAEFSETSKYNTCPINQGTINQLNSSNSRNVYQQLNRAFLVDNPTKVFKYNNVKNIDENKFFTSNKTYLSISRDNTSKEGYIDVEISNLNLFTGFEMFFESKEHSFSKVEIYNDDVLLEKIVSGKADIIYTKPTYESIYNNQNKKIKLRCFVTNEVRLRVANIYS